MDLMKPELPEHRVIPFRPRRKKSRPDRPDKAAFRTADGPSPVRDLSRYQRPAERDDYGTRMRVNALVLAFTTTLVAAGVWIVTMLAHPHS